MIGPWTRCPSCPPCPAWFRLAALVVALAWPVAGPRAADDQVGDAAASEEQAQDEGNVVDLGANFDANVFEQAGGGWVLRADGPAAGGEPPPVLARVRAVGASRLARVARTCTLTEPQRRKLELALEADLRRCVAEIEQIRLAYTGVSVNIRDREGQQKWNRFQQDVQRCRRRLLTLFDESSLFAAALATVLDDGQREALATEIAARRSFRWQALVASAMLRLDDALALSQAQHDEIERLLLGREPPLRLDPPGRQRNEQAEQMLVFMQLAEVDQAALKAAVDPDRWKTLLTLANQGRSMRSWIEGQGLLEPRRK